MLDWVVWLQVTHETVVKMSAGATISPRLDWG